MKNEIRGRGESGQHCCALIGGSYYDYEAIKTFGQMCFNPIVVGLFDSTILVGGAKKPPLPNS